jgi:hypothetical protein
MTELLQRAIVEMQKLPAEEQDAIAARILADLDDERSWAAQFAATTGDQWDRMAEQVRRDIEAGDTIPLDVVFPPQPPKG